MIHRPHLVHALSHARDVHATRCHRHHLRNKLLRELLSLGVLNEPLTIPPSNHQLQNKGPKDRAGWGLRPNSCDQGGGEVSLPASNVEDKLIEDSLPELNIVEEVTEEVGFDAGPLIFALRHLLLATTSVTPADAIRQSFGVHLVEASSEDTRLNVRKCHRLLLAF